MSEFRAEIARSKKSLVGARVLLDADLFDQSLSRSYYAAFYAARAMLAKASVSPRTHSGMVSAFSRLIREGDFDPEISKSFRRLFQARNAADHGPDDTPREKAESALADAERLVLFVEESL